MLDLAAERQHKDAIRVGGHHSGRRNREGPAHVLRNGRHPGAAVVASIAGGMARQEPCPYQQDEEESSEQPPTPPPVKKNKKTRTAGKSEAVVTRTALSDD